MSLSHLAAAADEALARVHQRIDYLITRTAQSCTQAAADVAVACASVDGEAQKTLAAFAAARRDVSKRAEAAATAIEVVTAQLKAGIGEGTAALEGEDALVIALALESVSLTVPLAPVSPLHPLLSLASSVLEVVCLPARPPVSLVESCTAVRLCTVDAAACVLSGPGTQRYAGGIAGAAGLNVITVVCGDGRGGVAVEVAPSDITLSVCACDSGLSVGGVQRATVGPAGVVTLRYEVEAGQLGDILLRVCVCGVDVPGSPFRLRKTWSLGPGLTKCHATRAAMGLVVDEAGRRFAVACTEGHLTVGGRNGWLDVHDTATGERLRTIHTRKLDRDFCLPEHVCLSGRGHILVCCPVKATGVLEVSFEGDLVAKFGLNVLPDAACALGACGEYVVVGRSVSEPGPRAVMISYPAGVPLGAFGEPGNGKGQCKQVSCVAISPDSASVLLGDASTHRFLLFSRDGTLMHWFATTALPSPSSALWAGTDLIVCDSVRGCITTVDPYTRAVTVIAPIVREARAVARCGDWLYAVASNGAVHSFCYA